MLTVALVVFLVAEFIVSMVMVLGKVQLGGICMILTVLLFGLFSLALGIKNEFDKVHKRLDEQSKQRSK